MSKNGLDKWFKQKWVDIGSKRKDGSFAKCGRSKQKKDAKRKYPKCVPLAKARRMSEGQRRSAVARKRAAANVGPKPRGPEGGPGKMGPKSPKFKAITIDRDKSGKLYQVEKKAKGGRAGYRKGGGVCLRGMNRDAIGKNS